VHENAIVVAASNMVMLLIELDLDDD